MSVILCPICNQPLSDGVESSVCNKGHEFTISDNIIDLLPNMNDETIKEEQEHWDHYCLEDTASIANSYYKSKIIQDYDSTFYKYITDEWSDYPQRSIHVAEIGCGPGSAIRYLTGINFAKVDYVGIDVSFQSMIRSRDLCKINPNWSVRFVRATANKAMFKNDTLDMVLSNSALHHLRVDDVINWVSKSLKSGGLFIMHEPSEKNPFAKLGRKFVRDFHTKGEKPLDPRKIEKIANENGLQLIHEKGLHFLSGPMMYCVEILHFPPRLSTLSYSVSNFIDRFINSPSWNYSFVQIYRRV